jgi:hypothetical protein
MVETSKDSLDQRSNSLLPSLAPRFKEVTQNKVTLDSDKNGNEADWLKFEDTTVTKPVVLHHIFEGS